jgi:transcriptional regulator with XRE-family HTH domain
MLTVFSVESLIPDRGYYKSNKQIYPINRKSYKISNNMDKKETPEQYEPKDGVFYVEDLDARAFAKWLRSAYEKSNFKTLTQLAEAAGSNKATISRLMSGAPQTLTGKPSKPRTGLVMKLAEVLNASEDEGMFYAGHPVYGKPYKKPTNLPELLESLDALGIEIDWASVKGNFDNYTPDDFEELKEQIAADAGLKIKRITKR